MKHKNNTIPYDTNLTADDIDAIRRSEKEFERGECYDFDEVYNELRNKHSQ